MPAFRPTACTPAGWLYPVIPLVDSGALPAFDSWPFAEEVGGCLATHRRQFSWSGVWVSVQGLPANQLRLLRMTPKHGGEQTVAPGHGAVPATSDRLLKRWRWVSPLVGCGTVHGLPANSMHNR